MFNPKLVARVTALETRVSTLEKVKQQTYASIYDNPPSVEHAFAIREILSAAKVLADAHAKDPFGTPLNEPANQILNLLMAIEK